MKVNELIYSENGNTVKNQLTIENSKIVITKNKLKEIKEAFDEGLITMEEYEKAKKNFLNYNS